MVRSLPKLAWLPHNVTQQEDERANASLGDELSGEDGHGDPNADELEIAKNTLTSLRFKLKSAREDGVEQGGAMRVRMEAATRWQRRATAVELLGDGVAVADKREKDEMNKASEGSSGVW